MTLEFFDRQQASNPANGTRIEREGDLLKILDGLLKREPFFCELVADNGYKQLIGIGERIGCVQHSQNDGSPPYLMAVEGNELTGQPYAEFLMGHAPTPVSTRYCMPFDKVRQIAIHFLRTGERDPSVPWEEI